MSITNKTKIPDIFLIPILQSAARRIGIKTKTFQIKLTAKRSTYTQHSGLAINGFTKRVELKIAVNSLVNPITLAEDLYDLCLHEFAHIKDYTQGLAGPQGSSYANPDSLKRMPHHMRPCERRAFQEVDRAQEKPITLKTQEAILNLGIWYEENRSNVLKAQELKAREIREMINNALWHIEKKK